MFVSWHHHRSFGGSRAQRLPEPTPIGAAADAAGGGDSGAAAATPRRHDNGHRGRNQAVHVRLRPDAASVPQRRSGDARLHRRATVLHHSSRREGRRRVPPLARQGPPAGRFPSRHLLHFFLEEEMIRIGN